MVLMMAACYMYVGQARGDEEIRFGIKPWFGAGCSEEQRMYPKPMDELQDLHASTIADMLAYEEEERHLFPIVEAAMSRYIDYLASLGLDWRSEPLPCWFQDMARYAERAAFKHSDEELVHFGVSNPLALRQMILGGVIDKYIKKREKEEVTHIPDEQLKHFMEELARDYDAIRRDKDVSTYAHKLNTLTWRYIAMYAYLDELCGYDYPRELKKSLYTCFLYMNDEEMNEFVHRTFESSILVPPIKLEEVLKDMTYESFIRRLKTDIDALFSDEI